VAAVNAAEDVMMSDRSDRPGARTRAGAVVMVFLALMTGCDGGEAPAGNRAFFTVDDGRTWFADDAGKLAPFDHQGKTAYQVFVWTSDGGKTRFASHLQRYAPDARRKVEAARAPGAVPDRGMHQAGVISAGLEVKSPGTGDGGWVKLQTAKGAAIAQPKCPPGGNPQDLQPVLP
jgi:hypothetical protein